jgi:hypothetical protein
MKQIAMMAIGVAAGAGITHIILRPVEKKLTEKWPVVGKFLAAGEVFLGGLIALKSKNNFVKSIGVGVLAGGVHGLMKQANIYKQLPHVAGSDDYTTLKIPISGNLDRMVAGILDDNRRNIRTEMVAGTKHTEVVAGMGDVVEEEMLFYPVKGW